MRQKGLPSIHMADGSTKNGFVRKCPKRLISDRTSGATRGGACWTEQYQTHSHIVAHEAPRPVAPSPSDHHVLPSSAYGASCISYTDGSACPLLMSIMKRTLAQLKEHTATLHNSQQRFLSTTIHRRIPPSRVEITTSVTSVLLLSRAGNYQCRFWHG
ncbi:hypothetical protein PENSPDRAFT_333164 [Peniophora sp. CONT]|nr:hypothetical protein PENSPDRAFT_333164 [Peniophora sp. CONT]